MIIQCPYCATSYQLDPARLTGKNPMLKCSRCDHIFPAPSAKGKKRPAPTPPAPDVAVPAAEKSLTLPFDEPQWKADTETAAANNLDVSEPEEDFTLGDEEKPEGFTLPDDASDRDVTRPAPPAASAIAPPPPVYTDAAVDEDEEDDGEVEWDEEESAPEPRRAATSPVVPLLVFAGVVTAIYFVIASALISSPILRHRFLGRLPIIGSLGGDRLLTRKVALSEVVGNYQRIKDGKQVFVITGKALNTATVALHSVQIAGRLYDREGRALDEKVIYCGNVVSAKVLKDLTPRELSVLQRLNPTKRFMLEPGESSTFFIVFMKPPRGAVDYAVQVVGAQHQA